MQIWKSQNFPPSTSYVWARLNSNYQIVGYFKYEGGKWVLKKKEELEESTSGSGGGSSNQSIIDAIVNGAPEEYDTLSEIAVTLNNLSNVAFSGDYDDLSGTPTIPTVPTDVSELNNDAGYLTTTNQQIPSGWETNGTMADLIKDINEDETAIAGKSYFGTVSVRDLPANLIQAEMKIEVMVYDESVPLDPDHNMYQKVISFTVTSSNVSPYHWEYTSSWGNTGNWRSFLTEHQSLSNYALKSEIPEVPTNISAFNNDSGYLTSHQDISGKADKVSSPTSGNFAGLDGNGNLTDSESKASDFATAAQGTKADGAVRFDASQSLTDAQKEQAISNIGASPDRALVSSAEYFPIDYNSKTLEQAAALWGVSTEEFSALYDGKYTHITNGVETLVVLDWEEVPTVEEGEKMHSLVLYGGYLVRQLRNSIRGTQDIITGEIVWHIEYSQTAKYFSITNAESTDNRRSTWQSTPDNTHYPSEKLVKDSLDGKQATIDNNHKLPYSLLSDTPDLSGFITKSVNDLANYYLKTETYTKSEVEALIAAINQFHYEIYASTSAVTSPATNVLYLIGPTGSGADKYEEYVYSNNAFVKIGDTSIDLSGYVTTSALNTALADYTTTAALTLLLAAKQDVIDSTHKLPYAYLSDTPTIPDEVEANPTIPSGTTPTDLTGLKIGSSYYTTPNPAALSNNDIDTIWTNTMS